MSIVKFSFPTTIHFGPGARALVVTSCEPKASSAR